MLDNIPKQPSKFRTKNWVEINDGSYGINNTGSQTKFKTSMLRSILFDYSDVYIGKEIDHAKNMDVVMPMYNLIEYSDKYLKTSRSLWQYFRDEPFTADNGNIIDVSDDADSTSFKYKQKIRRPTGSDERKDLQVMVTLRHLSNFRRTLEMPLIVKLTFFNLV